MKIANVIAVLSLVFLGSSASAVTLGPISGLTMDEIDGTSPNPSNGNFVSLARNPTGGSVTNNLTVASTVNHSDNGNRGFFTPDLSYPSVGGSNFLVRYTGFIDVPTSGLWSLHNQADDPFFVEFGGNGANWTDTSCCNNQQVTRNLVAGIQSIEIIFAEFGGGDHVEFAMGFGDVNGAPLSLSGGNYQLLGVQNGGLAIATTVIPEPTTATLGLIGLAGVLVRRRRAA